MNSIEAKQRMDAFNRMLESYLYSHQDRCLIAVTAIQHSVKSPEMMKAIAFLQRESRCKPGLYASLIKWLTYEVIDG